MVVSEEATRYKHDVFYQVRQQGWVDPIDGPVWVTVSVYRPRMSGDLDNRLKVVLDALQGLLYKDDSQIVEIHAYRFDDKVNPRVEIMVTESGD